MSDTLLPVTLPADEPVQVAEFVRQLGIPSYSDETLALAQADNFSGFLMAAREDCEKWCRRGFITRSYLLRLDGFPGSSLSYDREGFAAIRLPRPPFQSIDSFSYVDTSGAVQTLALDVSYGSNIAAPMYGYQLQRGSMNQAACLIPPWARPWPPVRRVPACVVVQFQAGYGQPVTVSLGQGSAQLSAPGYSFNLDAAPLLLGDTGMRITIPGAGANGGDLKTFVASVDGSGNATLASPALTAVDSVPAWLGYPVPHGIRLAIKFLAQFYYEQGSVVDVPMPRVVKSLLEKHRILGC